MKQRKEIKTGHLLTIVFCLGIILLACILRFSVFNKTSNPSIITTSTLTKAIDVTELSAAEFRYKGIADIYSRLGGRIAVSPNLMGDKTRIEVFPTEGLICERDWVDALFDEMESIMKQTKRDGGFFS